MEISAQIRKNRAEKGMSQDELARAIFVSRQTVCNWETDKTYPDVQSILLLSRLFGVSTDELIKGDLAAMQQKMKDDASAMKWLTAGMGIMILGAVICFITLAALWREPTTLGNLTMGELVGSILFIVFYAVGMVAAVCIERIKGKHDLVTYQEIMEFCNGNFEAGEREVHAFSRSHPVMTMLVKFIFSAAAGALVGVVIYMVVW